MVVVVVGGGGEGRGEGRDSFYNTLISTLYTQLQESEILHQHTWFSQTPDIAYQKRKNSIQIIHRK